MMIFITITSTDVYTSLISVVDEGKILLITELKNLS